MYNGRSVHLDGVALIGICGVAWIGVLGLVVLAVLGLRVPESLVAVVAAAVGSLATFLTPLLGRGPLAAPQQPQGQNIHNPGA